VERSYGVVGTTGSANRIIPHPGSDPISSVDNIGAFSPHAAGGTDTDTLVDPTTGTTDDSFDFRTNDHHHGDYAASTATYSSFTVSSSHHTTTRANQT